MFHLLTSHLLVGVSFSAHSCSSWHHGAMPRSDQIACRSGCRTVAAAAIDDHVLAMNMP